MELRKIDKTNIWSITKLSVHEEQKNFVATNTESILEAYVNITAGNIALPFGLYEDDKAVGFVMLGYGSIGDDEEPACVVDNYCIWRFMIDASQQKKGYGKAGMRAVLDYIRDKKPCGPAQYCWLSYEPENTGAKALYSSFGFQETGEICEGEIISRLELKAG